jgi:hypothetical protein
MIEADEVVDVRMGDKYVGELEDVSRGETVETAKVEKHGASFIMKGDEENRILKRAIEETGRKSVCHSIGLQPMLSRLKA